MVCVSDVYSVAGLFVAGFFFLCLRKAVVCDV